ncbi:MAG: ester cyclase, partial [Halieaceae bacterium]
VVAEGDRVVTRYDSTGTHEGAFQGVAPTGRTCAIAEVSIYRIAGGKIAEQWGFPDGLSHMQQLTEAD